jgi:hypothetical protein
VGEEARPYQDRLTELENRTYGLARVSNRDPVSQAKLVYLLEARLIRLAQDLGNAPSQHLTRFERDSMLYSTIRTYEKVRQYGERIFEEMIRFIDVQLPGPNGLQHRHELGAREGSSYGPNYRSDETLSPKERQTRYEEMRSKFLAKGGSLSEIQTLHHRLLKSFGPYVRLEYTWMLNNDLKVTSGKAGHVLLAGGEKVKSAGQILFVKNQRNQVVMVVVSNSSGNYKPDVYSAHLLAEHLETKFGISRDLMVITKGEPMSAQPVKVFLKGRGAPGAEIQAEEAKIDALVAEELRPRVFSSGNCRLVFGAL